MKQWKDKQYVKNVIKNKIKDKDIRLIIWLLTMLYHSNYMRYNKTSEIILFITTWLFIGYIFIKWDWLKMEKETISRICEECNIKYNPKLMICKTCEVERLNYCKKNKEITPLKNKTLDI